MLKICHQSRCLQLNKFMHESTATVCAHFMHLLKFLFTVASQCKWVTTAYQNLCCWHSIYPVIREFEKSPRKFICFSNAYYLIPAMHLGLPFHIFTLDIKGVPDFYFLFFSFGKWGLSAFSSFLRFTDIRI